MHKISVECPDCLQCVKAIIEKAKSWKDAEVLVADRIETLLVEHGGIRIRSIQYPNDVPHAAKSMSEVEFK